MRVQCDVCGLEPGAVLCCADEAALCSACNVRVHRANKLAGQHRRLPLLRPSPGASASDPAAAPLCDVCKERRGIVFCVEDRAILCAGCDEPIHGASELAAKHSRFLLVGAKLSADVVDQDETPSSDGSSGEFVASSTEEPSSVYGSGDASAVLYPVHDGEGGGGSSSSISHYLTTICPGWRVEDLLADEAAFAAAAAKHKKKGLDVDEQVPFLGDDLFDVVAGQPEKPSAWPAPALPPVWGIEEILAATVAGRPSDGEAQAGRARAGVAPQRQRQGRVRRAGDLAAAGGGQEGAAVLVLVLVNTHRACQSGEVAGSINE